MSKHFFFFTENEIKNKKSWTVSRFNGRPALTTHRLMRGLRHRLSLSCTTKEANIAKTYNGMHMTVGFQRGCSPRRSFGATWRSASTLGHGCLPAWTGSIPWILLCLCDAMTTWQTKFPGQLCLLVFYSGSLKRNWNQILLKNPTGWMWVLVCRLEAGVSTMSMTPQACCFLSLWAFKNKKTMPTHYVSWLLMMRLSVGGEQNWGRISQQQYESHPLWHHSMAATSLFF